MLRQLNGIKWVVCCSLLASGCTSLQQNDRSLTPYEQTRQQMETGVYRPVSYEGAEQTEEIADHGFTLESLSPDSLNLQFLNATGRGPNPTVAQQHFNEAQQLYAKAAARNDATRQNQFAQAAALYEKAADRWPESALQQDALYWAGQSYYFADEYPAANQQFELLLKKFPNSKYLDAVEARRFSIAMYWFALDEQDPESVLEFNFADKKRPLRDTHGNAARILDRIRLDDPRGKLADDATLAAANAAFRDGNFIKADEYYTDLRKSFPSSEHQFSAHLLGMQAKLRSYLGPDYSGTPLDEAAKLIEQIRKQFPNEAGEQRELLARSYAKIRLANAERKWARAQYRDRRSEFRAARIFYEEVAEQFADTPYAAQAQTRIGQIANLPATPETRFGWLVDAFPARDDKPLMTTNPLDAIRR
jgi:outer membrane protein assembly factor BamD (BamD/ComL family)